MRGLYAIIDMGALAARDVDPVKFAEAVLAGSPAVLQLRAKEAPAREVLAVLRALAPMCHRTRVPLVANDRADLASFAGCDMVHVGQSDIAVDLVRRLAPGLGVGISTHTVDQLAIAIQARPAYVAYGPVFPTASKVPLERPVGLSGLREAHAIARDGGVPLVAIGGINAERIHEVAPHCDAAATIAALLPSSSVGADFFRDVTARAKLLQAAFARPERTTEANA